MIGEDFNSRFAYARQQVRERIRVAVDEWGKGPEWLVTPIHYIFFPYYWGDSFPALKRNIDGTYTQIRESLAPRTPPAVEFRESTGTVRTVVGFAREQAKIVVDGADGREYSWSTKMPDVKPGEDISFRFVDEEPYTLEGRDGVIRLVHQQPRVRKLPAVV